jgi:hypothetical protein
MVWGLSITGVYISTTRECAEKLCLTDMQLDVMLPHNFRCFVGPVVFSGSDPLVRLVCSCPVTRQLTPVLAALRYGGRITVQNPQWCGEWFSLQQIAKIDGSRTMKPFQRISSSPQKDKTPAHPPPLPRGKKGIYHHHHRRKHISCASRIASTRILHANRASSIQ